MVGERDGAENVGSETLLSVLVLAGLLPACGSQLEDAAFGPGRQEAEEVAEIGPGLDGVELAAGQEGHEERVGAGALVAASPAPRSAPRDRPSSRRRPSSNLRGAW